MHMRMLQSLLPSRIPNIAEIAIIIAKDNISFIMVIKFLRRVCTNYIVLRILMLDIKLMGLPILYKFIFRTSHKRF